MCGIFISISNNAFVHASDAQKRRICSRGPDASSEFSVETEVDGATFYISSFGSVLSLRGQVTVGQPVVDPATKSFLCWNGEAWLIDNAAVTGSDTLAIFHRLVQAISSSEATDVPTSVSNVLASINGPYTFVFFDGLNGTIYYGRDFLGRRSLLQRSSGSGDLVLASVSSGDLAESWSEVAPDGIFAIFFNSSRKGPICGESAEQSQPIRSTVFPYNDNHSEPSLQRLDRPLPGSFKASPNLPNTPSSSHDRVKEMLWRSLDYRALLLGGDRSHLYKENTLAILFSGGLDCSILARISSDFIPANQCIDLLNVAFCNPRILNKSTTKDMEHMYEACPDRITGRKSYEELKRTCPGREWRFVETNVPYGEVQAHRATILSLMSPHNTEMDFSIALALYFASRGRGTIDRSPTSKSDYETPARVLLSGLGADELFGGYQRHATAYKHRGLAGLTEELDLDVGRIGKRNLGRDDRVMSHWGKEIRYPYLDEDFIAYVLHLPVSLRTGFGLVPETSAGKDLLQLAPGKYMLRVLAQNLGMKEVALEKKRAVNTIRFSDCEAREISYERHASNMLESVFITDDASVGIMQQGCDDDDWSIHAYTRVAVWNDLSDTSEMCWAKGSHEVSYSLC